MDRHRAAILAYVSVGTAAVVLREAPLLDAADPFLYGLVGLSAVVAILLGVRWHRPATRAPWLLLALGQFMFVLGDANQLFYDLVLHEEAPVPSLTDALWLPAYLVLTGALLLLLRARQHGQDRLAIIDSGILSTGFGLLAWTYVIAPVAGDAELSVAERTLAVVYPMLDLVLIAATFRLAMARGRSAPAQRLLVVSMLALFAADCLFSQHVLGEELVGAVVYPLWLASYIAVGAAALHPSMALCSAAVADPDAADGSGGAGRRLLLLAACSLLAPLVLLAEWLRGQPLQVPVLFAASTTLFLLVVARVWLMAQRADELTRRLVTRRGERRFNALVEGAADVILVVDVSGRVTYETPSAATVLGHAPGALVGAPLTALFAAEDAAEVLSPHRSAQAGASGGEFRVRTGSGGAAVVDVARRDLTADPDIAGIVLTLRDVSERKALEEQLHHQATHDALTGLPNRRVFLDRIESGLQDPSGAPVTLLYLDLDNFKAVNDTLGHHWGDRLLIAVTARLRGLLRTEDVLCRLGGDEFVALLPGTAAVEGCQVGERLRSALAEPIDLDGRTVRAGASVGIAVAEREGGSAEDLLAAADTAMYVSKRSGRDRCTLFEDGMHAQLVRQSELELGLRSALALGELDVAYQPLVRFSDRTLVGFEALVRWTSPTLGPVSPTEFIPIAESTGLVVPLGRYVLEHACSFIAECADRSDQPVRVAVNVSVRQLQEQDFAGTVQTVLAATGVPAHLLTLEITESVRLFEGSAQVLGRLKAMGVRLALDDFGTGYASLTHVTSLPIDEIKIDRSFVSAIEDGGRQGELAASVVDLGQRLHLEVVAEGIETAGQAERLHALGCDLAQGYLYGRPVTASAARHLLRADPLAVVD